MTTTIASAGTEGAVDELLISADSHVMEPGDLWTTRVPRAMRDQAPTFTDAVPTSPKPGGWFQTARRFSDKCALFGRRTSRSLRHAAA